MGLKQDLMDAKIEALKLSGATDDTISEAQSAGSPLEVQSETIGELITNKVNKIQKGNIGLIDSYNKRLIEIDNNGKVVWETKIPKEFKDAKWNGGADIEWLPKSDTFLIVAPLLLFEDSAMIAVLPACPTPPLAVLPTKLKTQSVSSVCAYTATSLPS